ncbi:hypothetical protein C8F04DRAFT_1197411 [Mycena alexandri]|uniref:Uncharacterized protein n=1 Tax=Mycena alexandri TaxID=1745969 RepID=A0AAD6S642_9AGAR|nr:hypothetical protein C8F04DRAFT_1197411 [Mycena alexandri]
MQFLHLTELSATSLALNPQLLCSYRNDKNLRTPLLPPTRARGHRRKDGRYYVVGAGHCGSGVFTDPNVANRETDGFSGYEKRVAKRWGGIGGVTELWSSYCRQYHNGNCHGGRLPEGWTEPVPVNRGCAPPPAPTLAPPAPTLVPSAPPAPASPVPPAMSQPAWTSPAAVRSSVSPSPLRPPPRYHPTQPNESTSARTRAPLNPNGSMSAGSSLLSAFGSTSSSSSSSSAPTQGFALASTPKKSAPASTSAQTPKKSGGLHRVESTPNGGYDTDYFYEDDSDEDADIKQKRRLWAVRGLDDIFTSEDDAFDALRKNYRRLHHAELLSSTNEGCVSRMDLSDRHPIYLTHSTKTPWSETMAKKKAGGEPPKKRGHQSDVVGQRAEFLHSELEGYCNASALGKTREWYPKFFLRYWAKFPIHIPFHLDPPSVDATGVGNASGSVPTNPASQPPNDATSTSDPSNGATSAAVQNSAPSGAPGAIQASTDTSKDADGAGNMSSTQIEAAWLNYQRTHAGGGSNPWSKWLNAKLKPNDDAHRPRRLQDYQLYMQDEGKNADVNRVFAERYPERVGKKRTLQWR